MTILDLLNTVHTAAESGFGGGGEPTLPERSHLVHRPEGPTWDGCDILATFLQAVRPSRTGTLPDTGPHVAAVRFVADIGVVIVRCGAPAPGAGTPPALPTPAELTAFAESMAADGQALLAGLTTAWTTKAFGACATVTFGALTPITPQGGMAGFRIVLTITLE